MGVELEEMALKFVSVALVATTEHEEPASPSVNNDPSTKQDPDDTAYDTEPVPDPPEVVSERTEPYVPDVEVTVRVDWFARLIEIDVSTESTAR